MRLLLFILLILPIQQQSLKLVSSKPVDCDFFTTDNIENTYFIMGNTIEKYWANGTVQNKYSSKLFGEVTFLDTQNPLQILVYYPDVARVVFLDNTLSTHHEVVLEHYGLELVTQVCSSVNNSFWVYDPLSIQLMRFDSQVNKIVESGNLVQVIGSEINPNFLIEHNNHVYLNDPKIGILVFDIFGTYLKTIPIKELNSIQVDETAIYYLKNGEIFSFHFKLLTEEKIVLPINKIEHFRIEKKSINALQNKMLYKFKME